ncbi:alpha/beta hydrolase [Antribacter sp. KLBMP9083]|uniref:Alpha/beta hydrolase n=1 Tax=Antribacter soli TaxID=2910976 RepID=A0AA41UA40_9MICO|nr:alpha/beta fold hydrolase [Antribacter soli]MCF4119759.1 alpha/beta hydrolase [Antribacter soli]
MTEKKTSTLAVPGAVLTYDVRTPAAVGDEPPLFLVGSPMSAEGFTSLAGHLDDRTVVTYDPRGVERSTVDAGAAPAGPHDHADDLHRLAAEVSPGVPVDVFATSGGAVNALAWLESHPEDVRTLVAHEPPLAGALPDAELMRAAMADVRDTYLAKGWGHAMAKFIALSSHEGPLPEDYLSRPAPDPAMFGMPAEDDGSRDDPLLAVAMATLPAHEPDYDTIRKAPTRVVPAAGVESAGQMAARATEGVATMLGAPLEMFPSDHAGFLGGEYGQTGDPEAFAARLREVL